MLRFSITATAAASTIALVQIASAADLVPQAPAALVAPTYDWTGFYIGANIGGGWGGRDVNYGPDDLLSIGTLTSTAFAPVSINASSALGGLQVGYNWQIGSAWLIGAEADIDWFSRKGSVSTGGTVGLIAPFATTVDLQDKVKWLGTVRARLGYLPTPNLLTFVTGGFAYADVEQSGAFTTSLPVLGILAPFGFDCTANVPCYSGTASGMAFGWTLGGGFEYAVAGNWTIRGEYRYVSLESKSVIETATALPPFATTPSSFTANFGRTNLNIALASLNYRF